MRSRKKKGLQGFTLIELLVVIGIIAILVALLVPTITNARKRSTAQAAYNVLVQYCEAYKSFLVGGGAVGTTPPDIGDNPNTQLPLPRVTNNQPNNNNNAGWHFNTSANTITLVAPSIGYDNVAVGQYQFGAHAGGENPAIRCTITSADPATPITYTGIYDF